MLPPKNCIPAWISWIPAKLKMAKLSIASRWENLKMDLLLRLKRLSSVDQSVRRAELLSMLREIDAPFGHYRQRVGKYWPENIVVSFSQPGQPRYVIGAHYDSVPESTGANDNAAAVSILLEMVKSFLDTPPAIPLDVVFF